ncbi:tetratricopeptide repeat protein [Rhodococcus pseudokoreensis]|uniref:Tetratricopeptide repeat protein n=1 Tax=Rhodococcus pseudokoreensis TaxID=2811421 RepID=A0A974W6M8_9NOCA|nr:tetratricopeptide repeat protein [Rhodococcus pseudokoreensis]QSE92234.1 tetratricopeptide repeat protein [Rhodococcus pseudokoreensis]
MDDQTGRDLLAAGAVAYSRGDVAEALRTFEQVASAATGDLRTSAIINAASMSDELGEHAKAVDLYREALAVMPADAIRMRPAALVNLSQALQHIGDLDSAQDALEQARELLAAGGADQGDLRVACLLSLTAVAMHRQQWAHAADVATESLDAAVRFAPGLAGHPLMNLAAIHFETGRFDLSDDFAGQALAAFETAGDVNAVAETQQNLGIMRVRTGRLDDAEPLLLSSQTYFERSGIGHRAGIGSKVLAFLAEGRGDAERASALYRRSLDYFRGSGAVLDVADVETRLATVSFAEGRPDEGEGLLAAAFATYRGLGLGLHCAQVDFWHATLLDSALTASGTPDDAAQARATALAVPAAIAIDAVRYTLPNGRQREQWNREIADPAMQLAFRLAYASGEARLVADLVEAQCAGTTVDIGRAGHGAAPRLPLQLPDPPPVGAADHDGSFLLGAALAGVAAGAGLPVPLPPRLAVTADGRIVLGSAIAAAEERYGREVRGSRVVPAW